MESVPKIHIDEVPEVEWRIIGAAFLSAVKAFYENPQNVEKFEKWKDQRDKASTKIKEV